MTSWSQSGGDVAVQAKMSKDRESAKEISNAVEIISDILFLFLFFFSFLVFRFFSPSHSLSFWQRCVLCFALWWETRCGMLVGAGAKEGAGVEDGVAGRRSDAKTSRS